MIVVAIIGVLAALSIYGISRYFLSAKTAEAKHTVGAIAKAAAAAYERELSLSQVLAPGAAGSATAATLCDSATKKIPTVIPPGAKVNPDPADQNEPSPTIGWTCLGFSLTQPVLYQYDYERNGNTATSGLPGAPTYTGTFFEASAKGDLDANPARLSTFALGGQVQSDGSLTLSTAIYADQEDQ